MTQQNPPGTQRTIESARAHLFHALLGLPAILAAYVPPRGDWFLRFARGWARTILAFSGVSVRVLESERFRADQSVVLISNHESLADILVILAQKKHQPGSFQRSEVAAFINRLQIDHPEPDWYQDLKRAERLSLFDGSQPNQLSLEMYDTLFRA